jgi:hypothetical protein
MLVPELTYQTFNSCDKSAIARRSNWENESKKSNVYFLGVDVCNRDAKMSCPENVHLAGAITRVGK